MRIIIFDDSTQDARCLKDSLDYALNKLNIEAEYIVYNDVRSDLAFNEYDLIFLDIEIGENNGIEFGRKIREDNPYIPIILTTNFKQYALEGYKIKADRYFLKPIDNFELYLELKDILKDASRNARYFYDDKISFNKIYFNDIYYVEYINRKSIIHTKTNGNLESNKSLKEWMIIFEDYGFGQNHKAFLINLHNIKLYDRQRVILNNGESFEITRHYKESFEASYIKYIVRGK